MPRLNRPLRLVVIAAAVAVVAANVLIRTPATPVAGGPSTDAAIDAWFDMERRDAGVPGAAVVVVRDGVVHAAGFGTADASGRPVDARTPFLLGSVSKGITALAVAQLAERGAIDLDSPVRRYLPEFALADADVSGVITVRQLLDQTSGIPTAAGIAPLWEPATTLDARVRDLATVAPVSAPGAAYHYSNANYVVLGRLVELVSGGESFEAYLQSNVFEPLAMDHASADPSTSIADGLGDAHRLWFGLADTHRPLDRADLAPRGVRERRRRRRRPLLRGAAGPGRPRRGLGRERGNGRRDVRRRRADGRRRRALRPRLGRDDVSRRADRRARREHDRHGVVRGHRPRARRRRRGPVGRPEPALRAAPQARRRSASASCRWRWARRPTARSRACTRSSTSRWRPSSASWPGGWWL